MKVLFIRPQAPNKLSFTKILENEPLELEYLHTGIAQAGHTDYIYDGLIERVSVKETIKREKPDILAVTGYITQEKLMMHYCQLAKIINPQIKTIVGGVHVQMNYQRFYNPSIDFLCRSESIDAFVELVNCIEKNQLDLDALKGINGLCIPLPKSLENGEPLYHLNPLNRVDINQLPIPDRSFFYANKAHYRYLELTEVATIKTSFSCPFTCNFCYCTLLNGGHYQERHLDLVIEELLQLKCQNVQIADDDFLVNKKRVWEFIERIKAHHIQKTFICYARADFVAENPELIQALADIGFHYFLVGLEAVNDTELEGYNKGTSENHNRQCVKNIHQTKAHCIALMIAPLDATPAYFEHLYQWVVDNGLKYVTVSIFTPIPGTPLYEQYKDQLTSTDITDWDFLHLVLEPTQMSKRAFYKAYYKLFMRLYKIAKKAGIYDFMDLDFYKKMLHSYLLRKMKGD